MLDYLRSILETFRKRFVEKNLEWIAETYRPQLQLEFQAQDLRAWKLVGLEIGKPMDEDSVLTRFYEYAGVLNNEIELEDDSAPPPPFSYLREPQVHQALP